jgi:hypothetical protein
VTRLFWIALLVFAALGFNGFLLYNEEVVAPDAQTKAEERAKDALFGMRFNVPEREANIGKMGFGPEEIKEILRRIGDLEEKYKVKNPDQNQIVVRIDSAEDQDGLAAGFCGSGSALPVRYAALPYLVEERDGKLKAVDVEEISSFAYADWAKSSRIQVAYEEGDRTKDRKEDATRMVLAALLARDEGTLLEQKAPWGGGFLSGWSWADVQKKHPGIKQRLVDYVALLHLVLESAFVEGGLCST